MAPQRSLQVILKLLSR